MINSSPLLFATAWDLATHFFSLFCPSNQDNIARIGKTILIGEDTDNHQNDFLWAWDPSTGELRRVGTTPYGSELTGVGLSRNLTGEYAYLTAVIQHPYGETDQDKLELAGSTGQEGTYRIESEMRASTCVSYCSLALLHQDMCLSGR